MRHRVMVPADRPESAHDILTRDVVALSSCHHDVVHRKDTEQRVTEAHNWETSNARLAHRGEGGLHIVLGSYRSPATP